MNWSFLRTVLLTIAIAGVAPLEAASIGTSYNSNNGGSNGGAIFFDVTVGPAPLTITAFDINTDDQVALTVSIYTTSGTAFGNEGNSGLWSLVATGTGTGAGLDLPTPLTLDSPIPLSGSTSYGFALVLSGNANHRYTGATNFLASVFNDDLTLTFGSAQNVPFSGSAFTPRTFNGTVYYDTVPEPATLVLSAVGLAALMLLRRRTGPKAARSSCAAARTRADLPPCPANRTTSTGSCARSKASLFARVRTRPRPVFH